MTSSFFYQRKKPKSGWLIHLQQGTTLLHVAAERGYVEIVTFIVHHDPSTLHARDKLGRTPLHVAAHYARVSCVEWYCILFVTFNADHVFIVFQQFPSPHTSKIIAKYHQHWDSRIRLRFLYPHHHTQALVVRVLLSCGADYDVKDKNGKTPIEIAQTKVFPGKCNDKYLVVESIGQHTVTLFSWLF